MVSYLTLSCVNLFLTWYQFYNYENSYLVDIGIIVAYKYRRYIYTCRFAYKLLYRDLKIQVMFNTSFPFFVKMQLHSEIFMNECKFLSCCLKIFHSARKVMWYLIIISINFGWDKKRLFTNSTYNLTKTKVIVMYEYQDQYVDSTWITHTLSLKRYKLLYNMSFCIRWTVLLFQ